MDWGYVTGYFDGEGTAGVYSITRRAAPKVHLSWCNNNRESLAAIKEFLGFGVIRVRRRETLTTQTHYVLLIERKDEIAQIVPHMLPHSIIKKDALQRALDNCTYLIAPNRQKRGRLASLGVEEIRRLYHDEHLSMKDIGDRVGVTWTAVKHYMHRSGIETRSGNDPIYLARKVWSDVSKAKGGKSRAELWKNPEYRERATAAIRAGQTKRQASIRAKRDAKQPKLPLETTI